MCVILQNQIVFNGLRKGQEVFEFFGGAFNAIQKGAPIVTTTFQWGTYTGLQQGTNATRKKKRELIFGLKCTNIWKGIRPISEGIRGLWP